MSTGFRCPKALLPFGEVGRGFCREGLLQQPDSHQHTGILRYHGAQGDALNLHAEAIDQRQTGQNVHHILHDTHKHRDTGVLHTDEPARQAIESQHGGSAPDDDVKIGRCVWRHIGRRSHQPEHQPFQG